MITEITKTVLLSLTIILFVIVMFTDLLYYRIPNRIVTILFLIFPGFVLLQSNYHDFSNFVLFFVFLVFGFVLFKLGVWGGGDAKLLAVASLWIGWENIFLFLVLVSVIGVGMAIFYLYQLSMVNYVTVLLRRTINHSRLLSRFISFFIPEASKLEDKILTMQEQRLLPYGVAIAVATIFVLVNLRIES